MGTIDENDPFRNTLPVAPTPEEMACVLWARYTEWSAQFADAMLTVVHDGEGNVIPVDDKDLSVIGEHDQKLYEAMKRRAGQLGISDEILERTRP